ncbi:hypothetical protein FB451DRAFT_1455023 [Mycena latifolia]|nr:hypothetical protein FB451DRAFT_1455023 [Mycena latifolia]
MPSPLRRTLAHSFSKAVTKLNSLWIVARIFLLGAEDDDMLPVAVSHVCSTWRAIALACPLDVQLLPRRTVRPGGIVALQQLERSLEIVLPEYQPFLANAALSPQKRRANDDTEEFCLFSGHTLRMRRLTVDGLRSTWLPSLFRNLTFLDYTHHGFSAGDEAVGELLSMLAVCAGRHELRSLFPCKSLARAPGPFHAIMRRVSLPWLVHLHLRVETRDIPSELTRLVRYLSTPALTSLYLIDLDRRRHVFPSPPRFLRMYPMLPSLQTVFLEHGWHGSFLPRRRE